MTRKIRRVLAAVVLAVLALVFAVRLKHRNTDPPLPPIAELESHARRFDGQLCAIVHGNAYLKDERADTWSFYAQLYDPDFFAKNHVVENGVVYRIDEGSGKRYALTHHFKADFEHATSLRDLVGEKYGFTSFILQSPSTPTVSDYVKLRNKMMKGEAEFIDNRIEPSSECAHSGRQALRCQSRAPSWGMQCSKAELETELVHFVKGDDYWFSGWYYVAAGMPYTIADLKSGWIEGTPGLRLRIEDGAPQLELKWADKPFYPQTSATPVRFPVKQWVHVVIHLKLSDTDDGLNELWLDDKPVISARGRNLPLPDTIYNHVEIGISAALQDATVFVDDVEVSDQPFIRGTATTPN